MGLFDGGFAPNTGWLGLQQSSPEDYAKLADAFGPQAAPQSPLAQFFSFLNQRPTSPGFFGEQPTSNGSGLRPGGFADRLVNGDPAAAASPQTTGSVAPPLPPLDAPRTLGFAPGMNAPQSPQSFGPTLDQRAYGSPGPQQPMQQQPMQAPSLPPQAAQALAQAPGMPSQDPGFGGRLQAGFANLESGGNPISAAFNVVHGFATGKRTDARGVAQENQAQMAQAVYGALVQRGIPHEQAVGIAQAAATDPKIAEQLLPQALGLKPPATMEGVIAEQAYNANKGRNSAGSPQGAGGQTAMGTYEDFIKRKHAAEKAGTTEGERVANAQLDLPTAVAQANEAMRLTNELKTHKGRDNGLFWHGKASAYLPDSAIPGNTDARDALGILNQIKGGAFLEAFKALKGGGPITEIEGKKATDAIARMDRSQSRAEFDKALSDYQGIIKLGIDRANQLAGQPAPNQFKGNSDWQQVKPGVRIRQVQ